MNENIFIVLTQILEKLESIDTRLANLESQYSATCGSGDYCEPLVDYYYDDYCEPVLLYDDYCEPALVCDDYGYCEPATICDTYNYWDPIAYNYCEPVIDYCADYYYDYTIDFLIDNSDAQYYDSYCDNVYYYY